MIFDRQPKDWKDLEILAKQAFLEMGYEVERNKTVKTVRGTVDVDVFAVDKRKPINTIIICECKHWEKEIPKTIVHGFRTVCSDLGVHYGIIISKKGFQSGALEASEATNIALLNFEEFQQTFFKEWRQNIARELSKFEDTLLMALFPNSHRLLAEFGKYSQKYSVFLDYHSRWTNYFIEGKPLPQEIIDPRGDLQDVRKIKIHSSRQYYEILKESVELLSKKQT